MTIRFFALWQPIKLTLTPQIDFIPIMRRIYILIAVLTLTSISISCKNQQGNELLLEVEALDKSYENLFGFYANLNCDSIILSSLRDLI